MSVDIREEAIEYIKEFREFDKNLLTKLSKIPGSAISKERVDKELSYWDIAIEALENRKSIVEELKKLKLEIRNQRIINPDFDFDTAGWCIDLIERNIKELKNDNKQL